MDRGIPFHYAGVAGAGFGWLRRIRGLGVLVSAALLFPPQLALAQFSQQGPKLVGTGAVGTSQQGRSVALSADGNTAIVGGPCDTRIGVAACENGNGMGAAWVYTRSGGVWTQQGNKLLGSGAIGTAQQNPYRQRLYVPVV